MGLHRRTLLKGIASTGILSLLAPIATWANKAASYTSKSGTSVDPFKQLPLPYAFEALEPYIDAQTMNIHYTKHAAAYVKNLNEACATLKSENNLGSEESLIHILSEISKHTAKIRNNAGGHYNHTFFWNCMTPEKDKNVPGPETSKLIVKQFANVQGLRDEFSQKAKSVFGSGWTWLILDKQKQLKIVQTANQDNPYMDVVPENERGLPLLALDVWEHAYYLKYQNRRADYIQNWWNVVNWDFVENQITKGLK
jgi:Fe-Mn family superoxide dismutase